ncbi:MAG: hypothetical protein EAZ53_11005 [Bacteroidetes bacterium]|nr:MAG: hypothetical protein EAZ53_11005 [Bacteroidota bacterium]
MKNETYEISHLEGDLLYMFFSIGKNGIVPKVVEYQCVDKDVYNLAFGDLDIINNTVNDKIVTNNGDTIKVISSVIQTIPLFFKIHPKATVLFTGSNILRTKLYNRILKMYINDFCDLYEINGIVEGEKSFSKFDISKNYNQFSIKLINYEN